MLPDLKVYYKSTVINSMVLTYKKNIGQWNRIQNLEINPYLYDQLIYGKEAKIYNGVKMVSSITNIEKIGQIHAKSETKLLSYTI